MWQTKVREWYNEREREITFNKLCERWTFQYARPRIYRLMIENAVIKRKDRNGSTKRKKNNHFHPLFFVLVWNQTLSCTLFVRNIILSFLFLYTDFFSKKKFAWLLEQRYVALFFITKVLYWLFQPITNTKFRPKKKVTAVAVTQHRETKFNAYHEIMATRDEP